MHELLARKNGNWYYRYLPIWGDKQGHLVTQLPSINGEELQLTRKFICYPSADVIGEIKDFFFLQNGEVFKKAFNGSFREKHFAIVAGMKVPPEYVKAVLLGKRPNISGLFEQRGNRIYRTDRTYWGPEFIGKLVGEIECCGLFLF